MKAVLAIVCLAGIMVSACASDGNPGGRAYAGMPGGVIATEPRTMGVVTYDPGAYRNMPGQNAILGKSGDRGIPAKSSDAGAPAAKAVDQL